VPDWKPDEPICSLPPEARASRRGLDWFAFFVADIQTGFGPFLSVYLTSQKWTQVDIGLVLSITSIASLIGQAPGGWLVDAARSKRRAASLAVIGMGVSALLIALAPVFGMIAVAKLLHVAASCVLGPALAAITLGLVGYASVGPRLGRNARFSAIGNGLAAAVMGACGSLVAPQAVFYVTAVLALPALLALSYIREKDVDPIRADGGIDTAKSPSEISIGRLLRKPELLIVAACVLLFHTANAALLPLVGSDVTTRSGQWATVLVAACIVAPQIVVALASPTIGELAQSWGRRPLLLIGFGALPLRAALLAVTHDPYMLVVVQTLDGVSAAAFGVLVPLVLADISRGTGHFNLAQGIIGTATGIGAALSTAGAGYLADHFGISMAFLGLAAAAVAAFALVLALLPETKPAHE
jgi:MFS family permease